MSSRRWSRAARDDAYKDDQQRGHGLPQLLGFFYMDSVLLEGASEDLDLVQRKVRAMTKQETRIEKSGQEELFIAHEQVTEKDGHVDLSVVKEYWLSHLTKRPVKFDIERLADMMEETGWFANDLQQAFRELEKDDKVKNLDVKRARPVNAVNFEKGERLMRVQQ